jgi:endogenous inhibitor of DNA gyrase (YacG/DUF329 family)
MHEKNRNFYGSFLIFDPSCCNVFGSIRLTYWSQENKQISDSNESYSTTVPAVYQ